jgi:hypothetical protein
MAIPRDSLPVPCSLMLWRSKERQNIEMLYLKAKPHLSRNCLILRFQRLETLQNENTHCNEGTVVEQQ